MSKSSPQSNLASSAIAASVEIIATEDLTPSEERDRLHLERKVERAFVEAGKALRELRERRLYRSTHKTFEEYCRERFGFTRIAASYKIAAAEVVDNLLTNGLQNQTDLPTSEMLTNGLQNQTDLPTSEMLTKGTQNSTDSESPKMLTNGYQILPTSERQVRPLTVLKPEQQREVWQQAIAESGGKVPSGRLVKDIVDRIREGKCSMFCVKRKILILTKKGKLIRS